MVWFWPYLCLISPSFYTSGGLCIVIVLFSGYLYLCFCWCVHWSPGSFFWESIPGCFPAHQGPFENVSIPKGKNLLPVGANSFHLEYIPFQKGDTTILMKLIPLIMYPFPLTDNAISKFYYMHVSKILFLTTYLKLFSINSQKMRYISRNCNLFVWNRNLEIIFRDMFPGNEIAWHITTYCVPFIRNLLNMLNNSNQNRDWNI